MNLKAISLALSLSITSICVIPSFAQEWFPLDASWYYNQVQFLPGGNFYKHFDVEGEAIIHGKTCRLVFGGCDCGSFGYSNYLFEENDKVFRYDQVRDSFDLLYDFTLAVGDTIKLTVGSEMGVYVLTALDTQIVSGLPVRVQHYEGIEWWVAIGLETYEYFGNSLCLYPQSGVCDPLTGGLRCYEDSIFGLQKFNGFNFACDTVITSIHNPELGSIEVFPNPVDDLLTIRSDNNIGIVEVLDLYTGRTLIRLGGDREFQIPVSHLPAATYLIKVNMDDHSLAYRKLVINHP
jgi:hypothetical protein